MPIDTNAEIARIAGVGRTTVVRYSTVLQRGSKTVLEKLNKGELTIFAAHNTLKNLPVQATKPETAKAPKIEPELKMLSSIEKGKKLLRSGDIEALVIVNDKSQIELLSQKQKEKAGVYLLKTSD